MLEHWLIVICMFIVNYELVCCECDMYIAPSIYGGRGVFVGRKYAPNDELVTGVGLLISRHVTGTWSTDSYCYGSAHDNMLMLALGPQMLFNHGHSNVKLSLDKPMFSDSSLFLEPNWNHYTSYLDLRVSARRTIQEGGEIMVSYGGDEWFLERGIQRVDTTHDTPPRHTLQYLNQSGVCLSDVYVGKSGIPLAGSGLFSKISKMPGEVVTMSPALILPMHEVVATNDRSVLVNYCLSVDGSDVAVFPFTFAAMANHGGRSANAQWEWLRWPHNTVHANATSLEHLHIEELETVPYAPLDLKLVAIRKIDAGEEVLVDYGHAWESSWLSYLDALQEWRKKYHMLRSGISPQFRSPIGAVNNLFPSHFYKECIGDMKCSAQHEQSRQQMEAALAMLSNSTAYCHDTFTMYS